MLVTVRRDKNGGKALNRPIVKSYSLVVLRQQNTSQEALARHRAHPCISRQAREGQRDVAVDLDNLADRARILKLGRRPPFHAQDHAVLALDTYHG